MRSNLLLAGALAFTLLHGESLPPEQKQKVDKAIPVGAPAAPRKPRRMLVTNPHISQTERTELKTSTRVSFPQPVVGRRS